ENQAHAFDDLALGLHRVHRAVGEVDGDVVRGGEVEYAVRVIAVLVGDQHAVDVGGFEAEARQPLLCVAQVEPAVDEDTSPIGFGYEAVAAAAARERSETQQLYFSCSCSSARMRCAVDEVSAPPSLFRTCTMLASFSGFTCTRYCSAFTLPSLEPTRREKKLRS